MKATALFKTGLTISTALSALLFAGSVHAWAAVTADPAVAPPTGQVTVSGTHFSANSLVEVFLKWKRCSVTTDAQGQFACTFKVPKTLEPGPKKIWTVNRANGRWVSTPFTVRTDWGNEAFDAGRTRYNPYENVINRGNVSRLKKLWTAPGTLHLVAGERVLLKPANSTGTVALRAADGIEAWRSIYDGSAAAQDHLYTLYRSDDLPVLTFRALRLADGRVLWTQEQAESEGLDADHDGYFAVSGKTPTAAYYIWRQGYAGLSRHAFLGKLAESDGHRIWQNFLGEEADGRSLGFAPLVIANGFIYLYGRENIGGFLLTLSSNVLKASDGSSVSGDSSLCIAGEGCECPGSAGDDFSCPPTPTVVAAGFGWTVQRREGGYPSRSSMMISKGGTLTALWSWTAPAGASIAVPALTPTALYVTVAASDQVRLFAFRTADGAVRWQRVIARSGAAQPTVANGVIYLGNKAYGAYSGNLLWTNPDLSDSVSPIVVNGRLYANQIDGNVSAWGLK